ncbi:MAG: PKD domain-containing protein [Candidatus Nealsonbacteria bacterium]|nr:PKD domain-containing protein [Candidatus Nealsonbacteria bacterium]
MRKAFIFLTTIFLFLTGLVLILPQFANAEQTLRFGLREHKNYASYDPVIAFSKNGGKLRVDSSTFGLGMGYAFISVDRSWLNGKYIRWKWSGSASYNPGYDTFLALIYDGEYVRSKDTDFPSGSGIPLKGAGLLQTLPGQRGNFGSVTSDVLVNVSAGTQEKVTIFLFISDAWSGQSFNFDLDWFQINSGAGGSGALYQEDFADAVTMERTGGTGDYGYISEGEVVPVVVQAGNVSGWAWSENIGWISFNCLNQGVCASSNYGVDIAPNGDFSGYAWSENIGWITFNKSELQGCPSGACEAKVDKKTAVVSGWARALANGDGWDGWIHLKGSNYGLSIDKTTAQFQGWAWGDMNAGWISFNCLNQGVCATSNYKVVTGAKLFNEVPKANLACDASQCNSSGCIAYTGCPFKFLNQSTDDDGQDDIAKSKWDVLSWGSVPDLTCVSPNAICDYTLPTGILTPGNYTVELYVEDQKLASGSKTQSFVLKQEAAADFQCSLDNQTWQSCQNFLVAVGEIIYFQDRSIPSQDATSIVSRNWAFQDGIPSQDSGNNQNISVKFQSGGLKNATLTVQDNLGRSDSQIYTISSKLPFPEFKEVPPTSFIKRILADVGDGFLDWFFSFLGL